jgi:adenylate kinase family enzyme
MGIADSGTEFKFRSTKDRKKKILINGITGTGKSTVAKKYCDKYKLNAVVFDIDDSNFAMTDRIIDVDYSLNANQLTNEIVGIIKRVPDEYDTIIVDGIDTLNDSLTPNDVEGQIAFKRRADNFKRIINELKASDRNIIYIGQQSMVMIAEDKDYPKPVQQINNMVNFTYRCFKDEKGNYCTECLKYRGEPDEL